MTPYHTLIDRFLSDADHGMVSCDAHALLYTASTDLGTVSSRWFDLDGVTTRLIMLQLPGTTPQLWSLDAVAADADTATRIAEFRQALTVQGGKAACTAFTRLMEAAHCWMAEKSLRLDGQLIYHAHPEGDAVWLTSRRNAGLCWHLHPVLFEAFKAAGSVYLGPVRPWIGIHCAAPLTAAPQSAHAKLRFERLVARALADPVPIQHWFHPRTRAPYSSP